MNRYTNSIYIDEIKANRQLLDLSFLDGKTLAISGATGMIGTYLIDTLLIDEKFNVKIIALVRDLPAASARFAKFACDSRLVFKNSNLLEPIMMDGSIDYIIHAASLTSPHDYHDHPIDTMMLTLSAISTC
jgi:nucleoside-diphosphate-sugar epimerase